MRQTAAGLNRGWLAVTGLILLLLGGAGLLAATGQLGPLAAAAGLRLGLPSSGDTVVGGGWDAAWVAPVVLVVGLVLALLGLLWLIAQVPRANPAKPFRLHDDGTAGQTWMAPSVLTDAVEQHTESLAGVQSASAVLRGTPAQPDLTIKVTASDRADLASLIEKISTTVAAGVGTALDTRLARLGIQLEIDRESRSTRKITI